MTVREIAGAVGKEDRTVQRWVKKTADKMSSINDKMSSSTSTYPADYTLGETCEIIAAGMGANAAGIFRANAERNAPATMPDDALDRAFKAAMVTLTGWVESIDKRVTVVEGAQKQRTALLPAPAKTPRAELSQLMRSYANTHKGSDHPAAWRELYAEVYYRLHINVPVRAKNEGVKSIDYLEREGLIDQACAIAAEMMETQP